MSRARAFAAPVIVGGGRVGQLFAHEFQRAWQCPLAVIDPGCASLNDLDASIVRQDIRTGSPEIRHLLSVADLVLLATPERVADEALEALVPAMSREALLVETLSVKSGAAASLQRLQPQCEVLGVNPMFGPDLGFAGNGVAVVRHRGARRSEDFIGFLKQTGAHLRLMSAPEHDRLCAFVQAATHAAVLAFGIALERSGLEVGYYRALLTPPARVLLAMLARMVSATPEIGRDIQVGNPFAAAARAELAGALQLLEKTCGSAEMNAFQFFYRRLRKGGTTLDTDLQLCARLYRSLNDLA